MKTLSIFFSILLVCRYGTWNRRLLSDWNSCQEFPASPPAFLRFFVLPDPSLVSLNSTDGETGNCTRVLSCLGGILAGAEWWEGGWGGAARRRKNGLNKGRMASFLTTKRCGGGGCKANAVADYLTMGCGGGGGGWWKGEDRSLTPVGEWGYSARMGLTICCSHRRWSWDETFNPVQKC